MFTLIGIGNGSSIPIQFGRHVFPDIFPAEFKTERNSFLFFSNRSYFNLVLLGQLLG
jgi:hypothetical protein